MEKTHCSVLWQPNGKGRLQGPSECTTTFLSNSETSKIFIKDKSKVRIQQQILCLKLYISLDEMKRKHGTIYYLGNSIKVFSYLLNPNGHNISQIALMGYRYLADPGKARGYSTNTFVNN